MATWTSQRTGTWSDDAALPTSPWNGGSNPATGVPANGDTVTVASSHVVTYDYDMSGFANGITLTITGTLEASTTAGAYVLKLQANLTGGGTLRAGTSGTPYPTGCTFTINRTTFTVSSTTLTYDLNCTEPTIKWVKLSAQEAAAQTVLSVDTDVTGDPLWTSGATLRINDVNGGVDSEERTFSSATSNTITISSGLTNQKEVGAYIAIITRNVRIVGTTGTAITNARLGRILAEVNTAATGYATAQSITIGGTITNCTSSGINQGGSCTVSAVIAGNTSGQGFLASKGCILLSTCLVAACSNGMYTANGDTIFGVIAGCASGMGDSSGCLIYGTIVGCANGISAGGGHTLVGATLTNTNDFSSVSNTKLYNCLISGTTENSGYNGANSGINNFVESFDHDQVANAYRAWTKGGIIDSDTGTVYTGRTRSYKHACATASFYAFQNRTFTVQPGGGLIVQCYVRKSATMTYLPRVWILTPGQEPFVTGSPAHEDIMTDSVDTWEELNLAYANGGTSPIDVVVRTVAKNASGNVYFDPIVTILAPTTYDVYNTLLANVAAILVDTNELQTDWVNGGRLDNILDARASQTSVDDLPTNAELTTALDAIPTAAENAAEVLSAATANPIDANIQEVNDVTLTGNGTTIPWGPA